MLFSQRKCLVNCYIVQSHFSKSRNFFEELTDEILAFSECFADNDMM